MKIGRIDGMSEAKQWSGWHVLTVAEAGFSMLDIYGRGRYGLDIDVIRRFAEAVNHADECGSLHPGAPISALPQKFFRDLSDSTDEAVMAEFARHIADFINVNEKDIKASRVLVDFHVSSSAVPVPYVQAAEEVFRRCPDSSVLRDVVIAV